MKRFFSVEKRRADVDRRFENVGCTLVVVCGMVVLNDRSPATVDSGW